MRTLKLLFLLLVVSVSRSGFAYAQTCLGLPSFAHNPVHVNAALDFPDSASVYALGVGAGRHQNLFANLGGGRISFEGFDGAANFGFLEFGYQIPIAGLQVCPIAGGTFAVGPDDDEAGLTSTSRSASAGFALGISLPLGFVTLVPNAAARYGVVSQKVEQTGVESITVNSNSGVIDLGIALMLGSRFSIQPLLHLPFAADEEKSSVGIFISFAVGK